MSVIKICPDCGTEYFPHIECCADCGAVLLSPDENNMVQQHKKHQVDKDSWVPVMVRKGSLQWMRELAEVLTDAGIPCAVSVQEGCKKGRCGATYLLLVSSQNAGVADECIEDYCVDMHPEIKDSQEWISQGKCPACGCGVAGDAVTCPDCGLTLLIVEE